MYQMFQLHNDIVRSLLQRETIVFFCAREKLAGIFSLVQEVNVLDSKDEANLALLARPELGITFTKLHCWRLTQYEKCVFIDADALVCNVKFYLNYNIFIVHASFIIVYYSSLYDTLFLHLKLKLKLEYRRQVKNHKTVIRESVMSLYIFRSYEIAMNYLSERNYRPRPMSAGLTVLILEYLYSDRLNKHSRQSPRSLPPRARSTAAIKVY